jgi:hypothetical protein
VSIKTAWALIVTLNGLGPKTSAPPLSLAVEAAGVRLVGRGKIPQYRRDPGLGERAFLVASDIWATHIADAGGLASIVPERLEAAAQETHHVVDHRHRVLW